MQNLRSSSSISASGISSSWRAASTQSATESKRPTYGSMTPLPFPSTETFVNLFHSVADALHDDECMGFDGDLKRDAAATAAASDDLKALTNTNSNYNTVTKTISGIHQSLFTSSVDEQGGNKSSLILDSQYYSMVSAILSGLSFCSMQHTDRRCRLLAIRTLSLVVVTALSHLYGYSLQRHALLLHESNPVGDAGDLYLALYSTNESVNICKRLEDDIVHHIVADTLLPLILQDDDELICTGALQTLGTILYGGVYSIQERSYSFSLNRHILALCHPGSLSLSTTLSSSNKSLSSSLRPNLFNPLQLLATRIMDSILLPRMRQVLHRITLLKATALRTLHPPLAHTSPSSLSNLSTLSHLFLTPVLIHFSQTEYLRQCQLQHTKASIAKRASEFDSHGWIREYIHLILEPLLDRPSFSSSCRVKHWFSVPSSLTDASPVGVSIPPSKTRLETPSLVEDESATTITTSSNNSTSVSHSTSSSTSIHSMVKLVSTALVSGIDYAAVSAAIELCVAFSTSYKQPWVDSLSRKVVSHLLSSPLAHVLSHSKFPYGPEYHMSSEWIKDIRHSSLVYDGGETLKKWMALLLCSIRGLPATEDKVFSLTLVSKLLLLETLPSLENTPNPHGRESIDLVLLQGTWIRPARLGYWIDIAMTLILPGPTYPASTVLGTGSQNKEDKSLVVSKYFSSLEDCITSKRNPTAQLENEDVISVLTEMLLVFCSVCCLYGEWLCKSHESIKTSLDVSKDVNQELYDWISCSYIVLTKLFCCLHGERTGQDPEKVAISVDAAAQIMLVRLLRMVLQSTGYLTSSTSIYLAHVPSAEDCPHTAPSWNTMNHHYGANVDDKISSIIDLAVNALISENSTMCRLHLIAMIIDAWTCRLMTVDFNDMSIVKMESQVMILLRQLADEIFTLRQSVSKDLILAGMCVEKLAVSISEWSEKKMARKIHIDSMETVQNLLAICLQTITIDDDLKILFSNSIRKIQSLLDEQGEATNQSLVNSQHQGSSNTSSLNESSFVSILTKYCTITLATTNMNRRGIRKLGDLTGNAATDCDSSTKIVKASYDDGCIYQIYKQVILDRCIYFLNIAANKPSTIERSSRPLDPFQVAYPVATSQQCEHDLSLWPGSVATVSGSSDPINVLCGYAPERSMTNDGTTCWTLKVIFKVMNMTTVSIPRGILFALEVAPTHSPLADDDPNNYPVAVVRHHRQEIKAGDSLTFSVIFDSLPFGKNVFIPCITVCGMKTENWMRGNMDDVKDSEPLVNDSEENLEDENFEYLDVMLHCSTIKTSIFVSLRPNPLIFFRNALGDESAFTFLWSSCAFTTTLDMTTSYPSSNSRDEEENVSGFHRNAPDCLVRSAALKLQENKMQETLYAWAFRTWCGNQLLVKCYPYKDNRDGQRLELRSDNARIIQLMGCDEEIQHEIMHVFSSHIARYYER